MSQFGTYTLSSRFPSVFTFIKKKSAKCQRNNNSSPGIEWQRGQINTSSYALEMKGFPCVFSGRKILESSIKCSVKPQGFYFIFFFFFRNSFHLRQHLKNRQRLKQRWEPVGGVMHTAAASPPEYWKVSTICFSEACWLLPFVRGSCMLAAVLISSQIDTFAC